MSKMKKVLLMCTAYVLVAALAIGGTIAYLQDSDSDVNVMTLGNVSIEQHEQEVNEAGELEPFKQAKELYPGTEISKIVTVENTGKTDAYFRTLFAFEDVPGSDTFGVDFPISEFGYTWSWGAPEATIVIDGVTYQVYEAVYNSPLKAGDTSPASLTKIELSKDSTNDDMEALGGTYEILVLSQAVQAAGFADAKTALDTGFGDVTDETAAEWFKGVLAENAPDAWEGSLDKSWFDAEAAANATAENPVTFTVSSAEEFAGFVNIANTNSLKNVIIRLDCDIDMGGTNWNEGGKIAAYSPAFNGTLDGGGHTIYNLSAANNWTYANAMFRTIGHDATIKNLVIDGANINNAAATGNNKEYAILVGVVGSGTLTIENVTVRNSSVSCKNAAGILVGGMTEGAIKCKNVVIENCAVSVSSASGKGGAILGDGWSHHDYDYAGIYTDNVKVINCTYTVAGVPQAELPLYNYVK